jgi:3-hydroxyacyl-[acyl-carrier-protein] dehydratase
MMLDIRAAGGFKGNPSTSDEQIRRIGGGGFRCVVRWRAAHYNAFQTRRGVRAAAAPRRCGKEQRVAGKELIVDFSEYDLDHIVADTEEIRRYNPQRFEMEQLTAIVFDDLETKRCVGYKDHGPNEFWARGHMPGMPLLPGVLMCEAAAQLCSYYTIKHNLLGTSVVGFGGMNDVRFRDPVRPGDRLVVVCQLLKLRRGAMVVSRFQGFVRKSLVLEGEMIGVPLPADRLLAPSSTP